MAYTEYFRKGTEPQDDCEEHEGAELPGTPRGLLRQGQRPEAGERRTGRPACRRTFRATCPRRRSTERGLVASRRRRARRRRQGRARARRRREDKDEPEKKRGFWGRLFGKRDKDKEQGQASLTPNAERRTPRARSGSEGRRPDDEGRGYDRPMRLAEVLGHAPAARPAAACGCRRAACRRACCSTVPRASASGRPRWPSPRPSTASSRASTATPAAPVRPAGGSPAPSIPTSSSSSRTRRAPSPSRWPATSSARRATGRSRRAGAWSSSTRRTACSRRRRTPC